MMDCPFLKYEDGGAFSWKFICLLLHKEVGNEYNKTKVECTCKDNHFFDCPYYKKERG